MTNICKCGNCNGRKMVYTKPYKCSPPSLHRKDYGGYEPNSNIKMDILVECPMCNGNGYIKRNLQSE